MKNIILTLIVLLCVNVNAQDVIVKKSGEEISSKVIEITNEIIKYKKFSNLEGPTYSLKKSEVIFVKYKNGEKDVFVQTVKNKVSREKLKFKSGSGRYYLGDERIFKKELKQLMQKNNEAYKVWKKGRRHLTYSKLMLIPGAISLGYYFGSEIGKSNAENETGVKSNETSPALLIAGAGLTTGGIVYLISSSKKKKEAIRIYNKSVDVSYNLKINGNGIGLAINF